MKHIKIYESFILEKVDDEADMVYQDSLKDEYWKEISDKFPKYNDPNSDDCDKAVNYIFKNMKEKHTNYNWKTISDKVKEKIHGGLT
jgi:hypothetical protein